MRIKFSTPESFTNPLQPTSQSEQLKSYLQYVVDADPTKSVTEIVSTLEAKLATFNTAFFKDKPDKIYRFRRYNAAHSSAPRYLLCKEQNDRPIWFVEFHL